MKGSPRISEGHGREHTVDALRFEDVSYTYSKKTPFEKKAIDGLSVSFEAGAINALIGHTGSGKSTLVQMMNGILRPDEGRVMLFDKDIWERPKQIGAVRYRVGLVFQYPEYQLFEESCRRDIAFGPRNMGLDEAEIERRVRAAAEFVGLDEALLDRSPFELSGGQKRRVALAGVIAMEPEVLVLDEPAAGLDPMGREEIFARLRTYQREKGNTMIIVSHSMEDVACYCDVLTVLNNGELFAQGSCEQVFGRESELVGIGLGAPQMTRLVHLLRERGVDIGGELFTVEAVKRELYKLLPDKKEKRQ